MSIDHISKEASALDAEIAAANQIPDLEAEQAQAAAIQIAEGNARFHPVLKQVLGLLVVGANSVYPFVREHYTPAQVEAIASSIIKICDEYGLDMERFVGKGGGKLMAWLELAMVAGLPLFGCIEAQKAAKKRPEKTVEPEPAPQPATADNPIEVTPA